MRIYFPIIWISFLFLIGGVFAVPSAYAKHVTPSPVCEKPLEGGLVQCGRSCDDINTEGIDEHAECGFCSFFYLFQKIVNWIIGRLAPLVALLFVVLGGFLLITSRGDPKQTSFGKIMVLWTLAGYALILVSWVIVSSFFAWTGVARWTGLTGGWWQPVCGLAQTTTPSPTSTLPAITKFIVQPYIVYPADKLVVPEYETAVNQLTPELREWYRNKIGETFTVIAAKVEKSPFEYLTLRCGKTPSQGCRDDRSMVTPEAQNAILLAAESLGEKQPGTIALIFAVGGGGVGGATPLPNFGGFAIVGDWVLEPISGVANSWGIPCSLTKASEKFACELNTAKGTVAHELGHAFGIVRANFPNYDANSHPPAGSETIMVNQGGYPNIGFLSEEIDFLRKSPWITP